MSERGEAIGVGPAACPFVALELDRDRRSDKPDYRHRCFAEPTPQPRAISHQAAYCLSPNFAACPIFQDWAVRAAANPIATTAPAAAVVAPAPEVDAAEAAPPPVMAADIQPELPAPGEGWPAEAFAPDQVGDAQQLSVFGAPPVEVEAQPPMEVSPYAPPGTQYSPPQPVSPPEPAYVPPPSDDLYAKPLDKGYGQPEEAPVPDFLAGRPPRPARSSREGEFTEKVAREDLIPSWERDGRYGAEPAERERTDRFGGIVTAIAVVAILGLGVAGVIFLPGLLAGTGSPARTPTPLVTQAPSGGVVVPTGSVTPVATITPSPSPEVSAAPTPTPRTYTVKRGDSLSRIARKFDVTVEELLAANPQIENPDHIQPGDVLTIPPPSD